MPFVIQRVEQEQGGTEDEPVLVDVTRYARLGVAGNLQWTKDIDKAYPCVSAEAADQLAAFLGIQPPKPKQVVDGNEQPKPTQPIIEVKDQAEAKAEASVTHTDTAINA